MARSRDTSSNAGRGLLPPVRIARPAPGQDYVPFTVEPKDQHVSYIKTPGRLLQWWRKLVLRDPRWGRALCGEYRTEDGSVVRVLNTACR